MSLRRLAVAIAAAVLIASCGTADDGARPIVIGSFDFPESEILGEVYRVALEEEGFEVVHRARIGDRGEVIGLLRSGEIDVVPEYLGSALEVTFGIDPSADVDATVRLLERAWDPEGFEVGRPAAAQSQNGFAMTRRRVNDLGITSLSELAPHAGGLTFGGPPECPVRPRCLLGLAEVYGIEFGDVVTLDAGGPATIAALGDGSIDVGLVFTSDPRVADGDLVLLADDRGLQPVENIVPVVAETALDEHDDDLLETLDAVSAALEQASLVQLNRLVATGRTAGETAEQWLEIKGLTG